MAVDVANNVDAGTPGEGEADNKMVVDNNPDTVETATRRTTCSASAPTDFASHAVTKVTMVGIENVLSIND